MKLAGATVTPDELVVTSTGAAKPFTGVARTWMATLPDGRISATSGVICSAKSPAGAAVTVSISVADRVAGIVVLVAVNVSDRGPVAEFGATEIVIDFELPAASVKVAGETVMPGTDGALTWTLPAKPFNPVTETLAFVEEPAAALTCAGWTCTMKSGAAGAAVTVTETAALRTTPPPVNVNGIEYVPGVTDAAAATENDVGA